VSWLPPASNGSPAITGYTVTASPGGATRTVGGTTFSTAFTGLTNGTAYTFTVTASNATGTSPSSAPSPAVTPAAAPSAPTAVVAVRGDKSATVSWTAAVNNGSPITVYTITANPGGIVRTVAGDLTSLIVTGLTNGSEYTFTVAATNAVGISPTSLPSAAVTPGAGPAAPTGVTATPGDRSAQVFWTASAPNGSPITGYTITASPGGATVTVPGDQTMGTVSGLTPGTSFTFTVKATSALGTSPASAPSNAVIPAAIPGAPSAVTATAGNRSAQVSWSGPAPSGVPISGYTVTASPGGRTVTVGADARRASVTGLKNGTAYTFTVRTINDIGTSPASAPSASVIPVGPPGRVTSLKATPGKRLVTLRWTAPAHTAPGITRYVLKSSSGKTVTVAGGVLVARFKKLKPGTYKFTITAHNDLGAGPSSRAVRVRVRDR
jgi:hypothetical protein